MVTIVIASAACSSLPLGSPAEPGAVSGTLRFLEREEADTAIGPVVVILEPVDPDQARARPTRRVLVVSSTDRFDPGLSAMASGDSVVFVNRGAVSHRFFSADLDPEIQIPVRPAASSVPLPIHRAGELRFFCSLHPEENFRLLVVADAFSAVLDGNGHYDIGPLPDGAYQLSIWSPRVKGPVRVVQVESGRSTVETIWLDPDLIRQ